MRDVVDVDVVDGRPVRPLPHDAARDDDTAVAAERHRLMQAREDRLRQQGHGAHGRIDELGLRIRHRGILVVEAADDEDLAGRQRDRAPECARLLQLGERRPVDHRATGLRCAHPRECADERGEREDRSKASHCKASHGEVRLFTGR